MPQLPTTMRSLVAPKWCKPAKYELRDLPVPSVKDPKDVLIKVHAAGLQAGDLQMASGMARFLPTKPQSVYPQPTYLHLPADENHHPECGFASEYTVTYESQTVRKPPHVSHEDAATFLGYAVTTYQSLEEGVRLLRQNGVIDGLEGKTVFVPGALSGLGALGIQLLKKHYGVGKIISTVSTAKVPLVEKHLPGMVDQVVDYKRVKKLTDAIPAGSVDFVYNTQWDLVGTFPLAKKDTGVVVSVSSVPPGSLMREIMPALPFFVYWLLDLAQYYYAFKLRGTNVKYTMVSGHLGKREDLEMVGEFVATRKLEAVKRVVDLEDIDAVKKGLDEVWTSKGGIGKLVIRVAQD